MLKGNNNSDLIEKGIDENLILFYQLWQELVYDKTLDIYQYRIRTSLSALMELADIINKTLEGLFHNDANIAACRDETIYIINQDVIMDLYYKSLKNRLLFNLGANTKEIADKRRLLSQIKYCIGEIQSSYTTNALRELKKSIFNKDDEKIEHFTNTVISQSIHKGWSSHALLELLRVFQTKKPWEEQWDDFSRIIVNDKKKRFSILIHIPIMNQMNNKNQKTTEILGYIGLEMRSYEELILEHNNISDLGELLKREKRYFNVEIEAFDLYSAAHLAIIKISDKLNMASFYNMVNAWNIASVTIVAIDCESTYHKLFRAESLYKTYEYLDSSGQVFNNTLTVFNDDSKMRLREKLRGVFGYANISRASLFQEEKYMNLWIALEAFSRTDMYSDIISNIKQIIPAAVSKKYIYRIVRNFVEDCLRCEVLFDFKENSIDMNQNDKYKLVEEVIKSLKNEELYAEILDKTKVNSLLMNRTKTVHRIVTDADYACQKIINNHKKVEWQIQRLYRIRNEIAHSALRNETSLMIYIEHLYDYLSIYISEVINCVKCEGKASIEEAICYIKDNYDIFESYKKNNDKDMIEDIIMPTGIIRMIKSENELIH